MDDDRGGRPGGHGTLCRGQAGVLGRGVAALLLAGAVAAPAGAQQTAAAPALVFDGVTVVDVERGELVPDRRVVIVDTRIRAVGAARAVQLPKGTRVVDARGKYLIPGLWDMHSHALGEDGFPAYILNGVTGVRGNGVTPTRAENTGERAWPMQQRLHREVLAGMRVGPPRQTFYDVSVAIQSWGQGPVTRENLARLRRALDSVKAAGENLLTTHHMSRERYFTFAAEVRRRGLRFGGYLNDKDSISALEASDSGATIAGEHLLWNSGGLDTLCVRNTRPKYQTATLASCQRAAERLRRNGSWWVPQLTDAYYTAMGDTITRVLQPTARSLRLRAAAEARMAQCRQALPAPGNWLRDAARFEPGTPPDTAGLLYLAHQAGLPIVAGTDRWPYMIHMELALLVSEGLTPLGALQAATLNPPKLLHATDSLGTVAPGKLADLVLLDADPLADITSTTLIRAVVANGRYYDRAALDTVAATIRRMAEQHGLQNLFC